MKAIQEKFKEAISDSIIHYKNNHDKYSGITEVASKQVTIIHLQEVLNELTLSWNVIPTSYLDKRMREIEQQLRELKG